MINIIRKKRDKEELSKDEINFLGFIFFKDINEF